MPPSLTRWFRRGGRFCIGCVNGSLTLLALLQAIVVGCLLLLQNVPIPDWIVRKAEARLEVSGLDFAWDNLSATFSGNVVLEGLEIRDQHSRRVILRCDRAVARFDLFGDPLRLKALQLEDAAFHGPPAISPQPDIPLAHLVALDLLKEGPRFRVERALAQVDRLRLALHGDLPIDLFDVSERPAAEHWRVQWFHLAETFESIRPHLARAPDASVSGTFSMPAGGDFIKLAAILTAPRVSLPAGIQARELLLSIPVLDLRTRRTEGAVEWRAVSIASPPDAPVAVALHRVRGRQQGPLQELGGWQVPGIATTFAQLQSSKLPLASIATSAQLLPWAETIRARGRAQVAGLEALWSGEYGSETGRVALAYELSGDPDHLLAHPPLGATPVADRTEFSERFALSGTAQWSALDTFDRADFTLRAGDFRIKETRYDEARMRVHLTPDRLIANPIDLFDPENQYAHGSYIHDFRTHYFRILAHGRILPHRLDSLLPSFYKNLWVNIDPGEQPVAADVDVRGFWRENERTTALVTASGHDARYKGLPVDRFFVRLRQAAGFVELMTLEADTPNGRLEGELAFLFPQRAHHPFRTRLALDSRLPLGTLATVLGGEAEMINATFDSALPPRLRMEGEIATFPDDRTEKDLRLNVLAENPFAVANVTFDWAEATAHVTSSGFTLSPLFFGLAGGTGDAHVVVDRMADAPSTIALQGHLDRVEYTTLHRLISGALSAPDAPGGDEDGPHWADLAPEGRGRLDLSLETQGILGRWDHYSGRGWVEIEDAPLGQIELFGGLSRLFGNIGLNLATFGLEDLSSNLILAPAFVGFPNLELRGPSLKIESQGRLLVPSTELDFDAKVFFLDAENPSIRSFFGAILRPFGYAFEVAVEGPVSAPEWSFKRNPLNLLKQSEESAEDPSQTPDPDAVVPTN